MKKALFFIVCLCFAINMVAQTKAVTGVVVDATGEPIIGASVLEIGTTNGTITDVDGNFTIQVPVGGETGGKLYRLQNTANCSGGVKHLQGCFKRRC